MATSEDNNLKANYQSLEWRAPMEGEESVTSHLLLTFNYEYPGSDAEVVVDTDEFTAVCPWTGLPDIGKLTVRYVPNKLCVELKSFKYYLLSYRSVGIVQEHAANRILNDLVEKCDPLRMNLSLDYNPRGGLHTIVVVNYEQASTATS